MSSDDKRASVQRSALWAAYGDALGFITELADSRAVERRSGRRTVTHAVPWRRRVGGQFGAFVDLPAGAISDDTQLRLATCRSILPDGTFDVEAFSKVELTVWPAYALGAGRGSKAAAANLARRDTTWASNFFSARGAEYVYGGGNGAAMRIQPHVWAAGDRPYNDVLHDVLVNAICTHGHPRGFLGAAFHAGCVRIALEERRASTPRDWHQIVDQFSHVAERLHADDTLRDLWIGQWQERMSRSLEAAIADVATELRSDIALLEQIETKSPLASFRAGIEALKLFEADQRGSGTKTALIAAHVALLFRNDAREALIACANALGTDTDTIATMAGALLGPLVDDVPNDTIQDAAYIAREAERMWAISEGRVVPRFPSVDLLSWVPPRAQSDVVGTATGLLAATSNSAWGEGSLAIAGLGPATQIGRSWDGRGREEVRYGWLRLWFGQDVLAKQRIEPRPLQEASDVLPSVAYREADLQAAPLRPRHSNAVHRNVRGRPVRMGQRPASGTSGSPRPGQTSLVAPGMIDDASRSTASPQSPLAAVAAARSMHELTDIVIRSGFDAEVVGAGLLKAINGSDTGIELAALYSAIIAKARMSRQARREP